jgi:hypothetical protein
MVSFSNSYDPRIHTKEHEMTLKLRNSPKRRAYELGTLCDAAEISSTVRYYPRPVAGREGRQPIGAYCPLRSLVLGSAYMSMVTHSLWLDAIPLVRLH